MSILVDLLNSSNASIPLIDLRQPEMFHKLHILNSTNIPTSLLSLHAFALPPHGESISVIFPFPHNEEKQKENEESVALLKRLEYKIENKFIWSDIFSIICREEMIEDAKKDQSNQEVLKIEWAKRETDIFVSGEKSKRLWRAGEILESNIENIEKTLMKEQPTALDLACGCGREAVFLSSRGWKVVAVDQSLEFLRKTQELIKIENMVNSQLALIQMDLESRNEYQGEEGSDNDTSILDYSTKTISNLPLTFLLKKKFDLVHVGRYLHRPLFPIINMLVNNGGFIVYHTFTQGVEKFGKPKRQRFILKPHELSIYFHQQLSYELVLDEEKTISDGRPIQCFIGRKEVNYDSKNETKI